MHRRYVITRKPSEKKNPNNMGKTILITGGAGLIGSHVVKHFVKKFTSLSKGISGILMTSMGFSKNIT